MSSELYLSETHLGREVIYSCLSRMFLEIPSEEIYKMLETIHPALSDMALECNNDLIKQGVDGIGRFLAKRASLQASELASFDDEIVRSYTRVYCLTDSVPISESVYTSIDHLSMQDSSSKVQALYKACSFDMKHSSNEPPDHISYELMFMSYLSKGIHKHLDNGSQEHADDLINLQRHFIKNHMLKWFDDFVKATVKFPESLHLYAPVAYFMLGYVNEDRDFLGA